MKTGLFRVVLPLVVVALGALGAWAMYAGRKAPQQREVAATVPVVRVQEIRLQDLQLTVTSQGTVSPRTESVLVPEVSGRVVWVSQTFAAGGFIEADEPLLRIADEDYGEAVVQASSAVARAELLLERERAEADVARSEWGDLGDGDATPLTLREPQLREAEAGLAAAEAAHDRARRNLERTEIRAPYAGRIRAKQVDVGQFVAPGTPLATVYAVDFAEIRLPIPDAELAFVDLPLVYRGDHEAGQGPEVILSASFAGGVHEWRGRIVRTEGEIDPRSRMVHAVARVADPYGRGDDPGRPPLAVGLFVEARILGRVAENVAVVPRSALRGDDAILVVDTDDRMRVRSVEITQKSEQEAVVGAGLNEGDRVCLTPLVAVTDGMQVRVEASR